MDKTKISVIVPIYKVEPYLRRCLDSIVDQSCQNLEIILVDDGSPDNCGSICDEYAARDGRIKVIHQENGGVSSARNAGLDIATGEWIAWVDPDDWIEKDMFQYLQEGALRYRADIAACGMRVIEAHSSRVFQYKEDRIFHQTQALGELLENKNMTHSCCDKLTRRALWEGLRFSGLKIGEDLLVMGRLLDRADTVVCLPEVKYNYLTRPESASTDGSLGRRLDFWRAAMKQYEELSPKRPQLEPALAGRSAASAVGIWAAYWGAERDAQKELFPEIKRIAAFCRDHRQEALTHVELGSAGRMVLRMTPYPSWWAFFTAWAIGRIYHIKHKKAL